MEKQALNFKPLLKPFTAFGKYMQSASPLKKTLIGGGLLGAGGLGAMAIMYPGSLKAIAAKLVEFVMRANPMKYRGLTPEQKETAINELAKEFSANSQLGEAAQNVAKKL